ncbi:hypothetical protein Nmel_008154 [Mimus melanotis]
MHSGRNHLRCVLGFLRGSCHDPELRPEFPPALPVAVRGAPCPQCRALFPHGRWPTWCGRAGAVPQAPDTPGPLLSPRWSELSSAPPAPSIAPAPPCRWKSPLADTGSSLKLP